jgi:Fe-S cluster biogenesis protein NfuA/nitrite reductase/ring-hydroxylating ferredoxin subunit
MMAGLPPIRDPMAFAEALETLLRRAEVHADPKVRELVLDVAAAVMHLHHEALRRIVGALRAAAVGAPLLAALQDDPVVGAVLADHGLLDEGPLQERVERALEQVRPYMHAHGGHVEVLDVADGVARLRLAGACVGCASAAVTLRAGVEQTLRRAVPELRGIEVEGAVPVPAAMPVQGSTADPGWADAGAVEALPFGARRVVLHGTPVVLCRAFGRVVAARDRCPRGGGSLDGARLEAFLLVCPCHEDRYDLRSGRHLHDPALALELLPVVIEHGMVRVAVDATMVAWPVPSRYAGEGS